MRVLVTGGAGFLGSHVGAALAQAGHGVVSYDMAAPGPEALAVFVAAGVGDVTHVSGQTTDLARLMDVCRSERIDAIVHSAGIVGLETSLAQPAATYHVNLTGMVNVCEAARQLGMARLIYLSSNAAYHGGDGSPLNETDPVFSVVRGNPAGHYGTTKMACEAIGLAYASSHGLDVLALRVTAIYGFGMRSPMYIKPMVEGAVLGRPVRFATGGQMKRDYTYVPDCAGAVVRSLAAPAPAEGAQRVFNVAAGRATSAADVAQIVRQVVPGADIEIGDALSPLEEVNARMRASLDISAARTALGWAPAFTLEQGIRDYADRFRAFAGTAGAHSRGQAA
ncbi:NAD(P)-dependent oxidoreductase [Xanthobacter sp. KR7-65]|uniref:NAD-dependent epimerase/dehydratase family protein n=1 Tax=Xanthobacter sp. KR7-65 TaxID=3156612 RepID=UPI0032B3F99B